MRQGRRELTKAAKALAIVIQLLSGKTGAVIKRNGGRWSLLAGVTHNQAGRQKLDLGHVEVTSKALTQPASQANMVGVHVSTDHALDWLLLHKANEQIFPAFLSRIQIQAGIHDGPAVTILK